MVSRSTPPELSDPSLSKTTAPIGKSLVSSANCFNPAPRCVTGADGPHFLQARNARRFAVEPIKACLELLLETRQHSALHNFDGTLQAGGAVLRGGHAARVVHHDGDDVLLGFELRNHQGRLPEQDQQKRHQTRLQKPDDPCPPVPHAGSSLRQASANQRRQSARCQQHQQSQEPPRPTAEQDQFASRKYQAWVFEEKVKHGVLVEATLAVAYMLCVKNLEALVTLSTMPCTTLWMQKDRSVCCHPERSQESGQLLFVCNSLRRTAEILWLRSKVMSF